jgi:sarcosine oxidase, subunit beta
MSPRADVVVVGAGVVGLSIALHLRERGASVAVVDRAGIGAGASGLQPGGVRQQWGTQTNCLLVQESLRFYADVVELLEMRLDPTFQRCGYVFLAHSERTLQRLQTNVALQNGLGVPSRIVSAAEAARLVPGLDVGSVVGGAWCAEDGYFDRPQSVVEAFARGLDIRIATVDRLEPRLADTVVVAAGAATADLLRPLGIELPIEREDRFLFLSPRVRERLLDPLVVSAERRFAAKQLGDGRVLASDLAESGDEAQRETGRATVRAGIGELLPLLAHISFPLLVHGEYDVTPDHQPLLGRVDEGLYVAAGFSGHGFMIAPAVARLVADAVLGAPPNETLEILDVARFAENRTVPEPQLI